MVDWNSISSLFWFSMKLCLISLNVKFSAFSMMCVLPMQDVLRCFSYYVDDQKINLSYSFLKSIHHFSFIYGSVTHLKRIDLWKSLFQLSYVLLGP